MNLLVIGNGVDILLGYPTKLSNCDNWLKGEYITNEFGMKNQLYNVYRHYKKFQLFHGDLWKDIENNIPNVDNPPKGVKGTYWYNNGLWIDLHQCFQAWVTYICRYVKRTNINLYTEQDNQEFSIFKKLLIESDLVLNFNYTYTLEDHFNIPNNKVIHIHGDYKYPVLGHGCKNLITDQVGDPYKIFFNGTLKQTLTRFYNYEKMFSNINISKIIFFGVSYGKVDWPYYKYMKNITHSFNSNCVGIFYYHSKRDLGAAKALCNYLHKLGAIIRGHFRCDSNK